MAGVKDQALEPKGFQQLTVSTAAVALTVPAGAKVALWRIENASNGARWRDDGTDPTAAIGFLVDSTATFLYTGKLSKVKFIRTGASDAVLDVCYYA